MKAYLVGNMRPVMLATQSLKVLLEKTAHLNDTVSHTLDFAQPLFLELRVVQDGGRDTGTMDRGVGVKGANDDLDLRVDALLFFGGSADERECTCTFTIETLSSLSVDSLGAMRGEDKPYSSRSSGTKQCCGLAQQNISAQKRPCRRHRKRNPGKPCRRKQNAPSP